MRRSIPFVAGGLLAFGLLTLALLSLFIVPSLYLRFAGSREPIPVLETLEATPASAT